MKLRLVKKHDPLREPVFYTERLADEWRWELVEGSLSCSEDVARIRFEILKESPDKTSTVVLEETP